MTRSTKPARLAAAALSLAAAALASPVGLAQPQGSAINYRNPRFGFSLTVPSDLFKPGETRNPDVGALWISNDGQARLVAAAQPNETGESLQSYRKFLLENNYADADIDYAPVRDTWFVLSGTKGDQVFYERVTFACDGRYIYGWQLMYPRGERRAWDRIVEAIHRGYRPGRGEDGNCG